MRPAHMIVIALPFTFLACCTNSPSPATQPIAAATGNQQTFSDAKDGIAFAYPAGWKTSKPDGTTDAFTSSDGTKPPVTLTLNVPIFSNPLHIFPMGRIRDGYVDDAKKKMPDAKAVDLPDPGVADAKQKRVKLTGTVNGKPGINEAVLLVHADKIFILSIEVGPDQYPVALKALDGAVASLKWTAQK